MLEKTLDLAMGERNWRKWREESSGDGSFEVIERQLEVAEAG